MRSALRACVDPRHVGETIDVEQARGKRCAVLDEPEKVSAARDEGELGVLGVGRDRG
ncbi:MAG TPA: hypothetical protein VMA53_08055 [Stellaceae bacterium]|nr:hypothetical protein [Stellaceae bacterium]